MTYFEAMKILDRVRDGANYSECIVNQALYLTGDIDFL